MHEQRFRAALTSMTQQVQGGEITLQGRRDAELMLVRVLHSGPDCRPADVLRTVLHLENVARLRAEYPNANI